MGLVLLRWNIVSGHRVKEIDSSENIKSIGREKAKYPGFQ